MSRWQRLVRRLRIADLRAQGFPDPEATLAWKGEYRDWLHDCGDWLAERKAFLARSEHDTP